MARTVGISLSTTERVPAVPGNPGRAAAAVLALAYAGLLVAAALPSPLLFGLCAVVAVASEWAVVRLAPLAAWALARVHLGLPWRWAIGATALAALVARASHTVPVGWVVVSAAVVGLAGGALEGLAQVVEYLRKSAVLSRGLPLGALVVPREPRALLRHRAGLLWPAVLVLLAVPPLAVATGAPDGLAVAAAVAAALASVGAVAWAGASALQTRRASPRSRVPRAVQQAVTDLAPDLVLYYGGSADALYQLEMWLPTFEASSHRTLVVLRDREALRLLRPTSLPVVCIPAGTALVSFDLSTVRGALFVSNAATNIHLIRKGGMRTAFIGHGDSDKASSRSPFTKVYDEIWVAGPAGAQRYAGWETSLVSDRIRLVGRPQAAAAPSRPRSPGEPVTVLYAPTWEGWGDEEFHSSLPHQGVALVRELLATPGLRVIYRPHPLTGTRDARVRRAHQQVLALLQAAGARVDRDARAQAGSPADGDDLALMVAAPSTATPLATGTPGADDAAEAFWAAAPPSAHRVVEGSWPGLASCFEQSHALVADVSSVVSDWLALDRPLALTDPEGLGPQEYAARFPSSRAGVLVGPDGGGLAALLDDLRAGEDRTRRQRAEVREHLLGSPPEAGAERFAAALDELVRQAELGARRAAEVPPL